MNLGWLILAHDGGWDELLMVAVPIAVFAVLLKVASKRADRIPGPTEDKPPPEI